MGFYLTAITRHERPGVYSIYTASGVVRGTGGRGTAALVAQSDGGTPGELHILNSYSDAVAAFGGEDSFTALARLLLENGAARVLAVPVAKEADVAAYTAAFQVLENQDEVKLVCCDSTAAAVHGALRESVERASHQRRERIGVVGCEAAATVSALTAAAGELNSERMVLVAPAGDGTATPGPWVAAAVAGAICGQSDPAVPLGGAQLQGIGGLAAQYTEEELDALIRGGVTPVELAAGRCTVVRGVTTRTKTNGASDSSWRELGTILVIDDVIPGIRQALQSRFARSKNTRQVRGAIRSQVVILLEQKLGAEIITGYDDVTVEALEEDPSVCLVRFAFTVAHGLNQIWLSAQITL